MEGWIVEHRCPFLYNNKVELFFWSVEAKLSFDIKRKNILVYFSVPHSINATIQAYNLLLVMVKMQQVIIHFIFVSYYNIQMTAFLSHKNMTLPVNNLFFNTKGYLLLNSYPWWGCCKLNNFIGGRIVDHRCSFLYNIKVELFSWPPERQAALWHVEQNILSMQLSKHTIYCL